MNRPSALIEGELAFPDARVLGYLPPPFGLLQRQARSASQREPQREVQCESRREPQYQPQQEAQLQAQQAATTAAQRSLRKVVRHKKPVRQRPLPPDTLFRFFYKVRQPRDYSAYFKTQLAEAAYYLDAGKAREHSSNKDYVLGAAIFFATGIALTWLLMAGATHDAQKLAIATNNVHSEEQLSQSRPVLAVAPTIVRNTASAVQPKPLAVLSVEPVAVPQGMDAANSKPSTKVARAANRKLYAMHKAGFANDHAPSSKAHIESYRSSQARALSAAATRRTAMSDAITGHIPSTPNEPHLDNLPTLSRSTTPSTQSDWNTHAVSADTTLEQAALIDWAAKQPHTSKPTALTTITRATSIPATQPEASWSTHLTQRRIVDNPSAFDADARRP